MKKNAEESRLKVVRLTPALDVLEVKLFASDTYALSKKLPQKFGELIEFEAESL